MAPLAEVRADDEVRRCSNPLCNVAEDGKCVEGFALNVCSFFGASAASDAEPPGSSETPLGIPLPAAHILGIDALAGILRVRDSRVIAILGPHAAGKTSLIASLYDLLQEDKLEEISFAGSSTLHAFELACHDARTKSRRDTPYTIRTPRGAVSFYHLDLVDGPFTVRTALLAADRAGEEYVSATNDGSFMRGYPEIGRADCITILIDGQKFADPRAIHNAKHEAMMTLATLDARGDVLGRARIAIVLTKWDAIAGTDRESSLRDAFEEYVGLQRERFNSPEICSFIVAASPHTKSVVRGMGVSSLLKYWAKPRAVSYRVAECLPQTGRLFDSYLPPIKELL